MKNTQATAAERAIAVVGASCRLPGGVNGLDELWRALEEGRDLIGQAPEDRFEVNRFVDTATPRVGKSYTAAGGFLEDISGFDAAYFGISPKEAEHMDPQHRLLLELAAEALDDAAIAPAALAGTDTAVYVGISDASYGGMQMTSLRTVGPYTMSGAASSIAANRLSHTFDLRGPSMAIDTACSSALVALDGACRALWDGTSRVALCGGANILLSPFHYVGFCQAAMLSVRGRCASFSAEADGFVRAEGGGVVVLKRLADALADGDRVHGVILGSATNNDGRTMGLALPNPQAQEDLLRQVYAQAGVHPDELVYFEAHGTGTPVGDPLEAVAIGRSLGIRRISGALPIGSVKSNMGHLEPASGIAGLCKALLVLKHRTAPASLHAHPLHPDVDFTGLGLTVAAERRALPEVERPVVGVNSFGFGGANAHTILTAAPPVPEADPPAPPDEGLPVLVSTRSAQALPEMAARIARRLADAGPREFYDIAHTSCLRRGRHEHRAVVLARTAREAAQAFASLAEAAREEDGTRAADGGAEGTPPQDGTATGQEGGPGGVAAEAAGEGQPGEEGAAARDGAAGDGAAARDQPTTHRDAATDGSAAGRRPPAAAPQDPAAGGPGPGARAQGNVPAEPAGPPGEPGRRPPPAGAAAAEAVAVGRVAYVFSGNGSQWAGMGADLFAQDAAFRDAVSAVDAELAPLLGWSVAGELAAPPPRWRLAATEVAQPLLFAVQTGLTAALRARGAAPSMVLGHSVGEVAAAHACGALTLPQAARVLAARCRTQAPAVGGGRMAAVGLSPEQAAAELAPHAGLLEIAGVNSPQDVTVAGDAQALAALGERLAARGVFFRDLGLDYAFHSRSMDGGRDALAEELADLAPARGTVPFYSTVTGTRLPGTDLDAAYWWRNVRQPVRFAAAVEHALDDGADVFVEVGPHPVLRTYLRRTAAKRPRVRVAVLPSLLRGGDGPRELASVPAALIAAGAATDWKRYFPVPGRVADLPAYPWQRERHWNGAPQWWSRNGGDGTLRHPLLGELLPAPVPVWAGPVEPVLLPWLTDHRVAGSVVMPATGFVETALAAGRAALGAPAEMEYLDIAGALVVPWPDASAVRTQVSLDPDDGTFTVTSTDDRNDEPRTHARARVRRLLAPRPAPLDLAALRERCPRTVEAAEHYAACEAAGLGYGPSFRVLRQLRVGEGEVVAAYRCDAAGEPYAAHPGLLDGGLQAGAPLLASLLEEGQAYLPSAIGAVRVWAVPSAEGAVWVRERSRTGDEVCWDVVFADQDGSVTARMDGCRLRRLATGRRARLTVHHTVLRAAPAAGTPCAASPLPPPERILEAAGGRIGELRAAWRRTGYERFLPVAMEAAVHACATALTRLLPDPAAPFDADALVAAGMPERYRRALPLLVPLLERHGAVAAQEDGRLRLTRTERGQGASELEGAARAGAFIVELALGAHQVAYLPALLSGAQDPLELLVAEPVVRMLEQFYDTAPISRFHNRLGQALLGEAVRRWPQDRALRVLEVGAGTGGTTAALLPLLPADRTRYCFTDASAFFLPRAEKRFAGYDFVEYRTFDLNTDPEEQGFTPHGFDLVVAANALHTAKDLRAALRRVRSLLAPGGLLLGVESHDPEMLLLFFGGLDSFYGYTDGDLRPDSLLLPRDRWPALLAECGFDRAVSTGDDAAPCRDQFSVFLAAAPAAPPPAPPALPAPRPGTAYVVAAEEPDGLGLAEAVADALAADGRRPARTGPAAADAAGWAALLGVAYTAPDDADTEDAPDGSGAADNGAAARDGATAHDGAAAPDGAEERSRAAGRPGGADIPAAGAGAGNGTANGRPRGTAGALPDLADLADLTALSVPGAGRTANGSAANGGTGDGARADGAGADATDGETLAVVLLLGGAEEADPDALVARAARRTEALRALAAVCEHLPAGVRAEMWLVTRPCGAVPHPGEVTHPGDAAAWGVARCLVNERPDLHARRVVLHRTGDTAADARRLARELLAPTGEDEVVLTAADRFVPRETRRRAARPAAAGESYALRVRDPGLSYELAWEETARPEPGPGQVVVEVRAAALNYRDMMQCTGLLPAEFIEGTPSEHGPGFECAGVVAACGPGVTGLAPGDRVAGIAPACLASHAVTAAEAVRRIPDGTAFTEAATAPVAFATVHYGLGHLAGLRPGETVLVHGAAGGVGLAAVQYARNLGARLIATAGTDLKRVFLRSLGIEHVLDSRSLEFAPRVMEITGGAGVDVVLNSLAGEAMARSLELLRPGGRFLELGKRDIYENKPLPLRPFGQNIAFFGVDLTKALDNPAQASALLAEIDGPARQGAYHPLPHSVFPAARVADAFRLLQHSWHVGKVVVAFDPLDEPPLVEPAARPPRLDPEATYLVTGGTGGLGAATADWLAGLGARHLALVSRRGPRAPEADGILAGLARRGVSAVAYAADAADPEAMRRVAAEIDAGGRPLRGVVHGAMHLDDAPLAEVGPGRAAAVLAPKMGGAAVADALTRDRECDLFLLYSSAAALLGNVGQGPYTAGNLYLEALARRRRRQGRAGLAVAWGAIGDVGYVARNDLTDSLSALGLDPVSSREAFAAAERLLGSGAAVAGVARYDWSRGSALLPAAGTARMSALVPPRGDHGALDAEDLRRALAGMSPEEGLAHITDNLTRLLAGVLHMEPDQLDHHRRLDEYGLDSLMAAELLLTVRRSYDIEIPPMELLRSKGTIADIAQTIHVRLGLGTVQAQAPAPALPPAADRPAGRAALPATAPLVLPGQPGRGEQGGSRADGPPAAGPAGAESVATGPPAVP